MRDFEIVVPSDCTASNTTKENNYALDQMKRFLRAYVTASTKLNLKRLLKKT